MKIYLPFKTRGFDGIWYWSFIYFRFDNLQNDYLFNLSKNKQQEENNKIDIKLKKRIKNKSVLKCKGHKLPKKPIYDDNSQCSICGGFKY